MQLQKYFSAQNSAFKQSPKSIGALALKTDDHTYERCLGLLLEGIRMHFYSSNNTAFESFQKSVTELSAQFGKGLSVQQTLLTVAELIAAMKNLQEQTIVHSECQTAETKSLIHLLVQALAGSLEQEQPQIAKILQNVCVEINSAKKEPQGYVGVLKRQVLEIVSSIPSARNEALSLRTPENAVENAAKDKVGKDSEERLLNLPGRYDAEERITNAFQLGGNCHVIVLRLEGRNAIEGRFGPDVALKCFSSLTAYFQKELRDNEELFYWHRYAMLLITRRRGYKENLFLEMMRLCTNRPKPCIEIGNRMVLASMNITPLVLNLHEMDGYEHLVRRIDEFIDPLV